MLILTRRAGQSIDIGGDIEITVLAVTGEHVRLGISAPRNVSVVRRELREDVIQENRLAASSHLGLGLRVTGSADLAASGKPEQP